jgi:hypothetical protein
VRTTVIGRKDGTLLERWPRRRGEADAVEDRWTVCRRHLFYPSVPGGERIVDERKEATLRAFFPWADSRATLGHLRSTGKIYCN